MAHTDMTTMVIGMTIINIITLITIRVIAAIGTSETVFEFSSLSKPNSHGMGARHSALHPAH